MGEQWRPHSAGDAAAFDEAYCARCTRDAAFRDGTGDSCPIAADGFGVAIGLDPPVEWQVTDDQRVVCTAFSPSSDSRKGT